MALRCVLGLSILLHGCGIWWGLRLGWAPDEMTPGVLEDALNRAFSGGWYYAYGPLQIYLASLLALPIYVASWLSWIDHDAAFWHGTIWLLNRLLTLAMSTATIAAAFVLIRDLWGRTAAVFGAIVGMSMLPLVFYAKLGNVDAPYVLWVVLALFPYRNIVQRDGPLRDYLLFATYATLAVCTKDQAYAFFVLPSLHVAWVSLRRRGWRALPYLAAATALGIVLFLALYNVLFNLAGVRAHFAMITTYSVDHRMYPSDLRGAAILAAQTVRLIGWMMNWVGLVGAAAGIWMVATGRVARHLWLLVPAVSYYVTLIAPIGYVYDRYLIGFCLILAMFAGVAFARAWDHGRAARAVVLVAVAFSVIRGGSINLLMIYDSRNAAAEWLKQNVSPDQSIGLAGLKGYLPPIEHPRVLHNEVSLQGRQPDFVVVNPQFMLRPGRPRAPYYLKLRSGELGYARRQVIKSRVPLAIVWHERRFQDIEEDWFTNLDKVNPRIEIYQRSR